MTFYICDISRYQHPVDFRKMKAAGCELVIARASVGDYYLDPCFREYHDLAHEAGLPFGAYHVTAPKLPDLSRICTPVGNTNKFMQAIEGCDLVCTVMDNELDRGLNSTALTTFLVGCFDNWPWVNGKLPINYTRQSWWDWHVGANAKLKLMRLFAARYKDIPGPWADNLYRFRDYSDWLLHQYSADGNERGHEFGCASDDVDLSRYNGTLEEFRAYFGIAEPEPQPLTLEERVTRIEKHLGIA